MLSFQSTVVIVVSCELMPFAIWSAVVSPQVSIAVNYILVEISLSPVVAVTFGLLFVFIGGLLFWQTIVYHFAGYSFSRSSPVLLVTSTFSLNWISDCLSLLMASCFTCFHG